MQFPLSSSLLHRNTNSTMSCNIKNNNNTNKKIKQNNPLTDQQLHYCLDNKGNVPLWLRAECKCNKHWERNSEHVFLVTQLYRLQPSNTARTWGQPTRPHRGAEPTCRHQLTHPKGSGWSIRQQKAFSRSFKFPWKLSLWKRNSNRKSEELLNLLQRTLKKKKKGDCLTLLCNQNDCYFACTGAALCWQTARSSSKWAPIPTVPVRTHTQPGKHRGTVNQHR